MKDVVGQTKNLNIFRILIAFIFLNASLAFAGPSRTTYQAKIVKPDGYPLEASNVNFKFTILDPAGACILYSETYSSVNMASTGGLISFALGSGVKTYPVSATTFEDVFSNITPTLSCDAGGPGNYVPLVNDTRKVVMQFHDGGGWQTLPAMNINAVPYAMYANESLKLNGKSDSDFVEVANIPTCLSTEALHYNGTSFLCVSTTSVSAADVVAALGYTPATGASVTALSSSLSTTDSTVAAVSSSVFSVASTVTSLQNSVTASLAAITSSQWLTSGTAISYSTGDIGIGTANPNARLHMSGGISSDAQMRIETNNSGSTIGVDFWHGGGARKGFVGIRSSGSSAPTPSAMSYYLWSDNFGSPMIFGTQNIERMRLDANGKLGIGTSAPVTRLDISGGIRISMEAATCAASFAGTLRYNTGLVEYCNGTSWSAFGVAGAGITLLNGSASGTQTFVTGISGTNFNITSNNGVHSYNIPYAASASVTAGLLSNADYTTFSNKVSATSAAVISALGYTPASATGVASLTANLNTVSSAVATAQSNINSVSSAVATAQSTINSVSSTVSSLTAATAASFSAITSSQWVTSGTSINYNTGIVGIGTVDPQGPLHILSSSPNAMVLERSNANNSHIQYKNTVGTVFAGLNNSGSFAVGPNLNLSSSPYLTVASGTGNVGIGTNGPVAKLDVVGTRYSTITPSNAIFKFGGNDVHLYGGANDGVGASYPIMLQAMRSSDALAFPLALNPNGGSVGIGTLNPTERLTVSGNISLLNPGATVNRYIALATNGGGEKAFIRFDQTAAPGPANFWDIGSTGGNNTYDFGFESSGTRRLTLTFDGKLGVGTSLPDARLHLASGTAGLAPLKLAAGTLLASPASGAIEYDGTYLYLTDSTNSRKAILTDTGGNYAINHLTSPGNITLTPTGSVVVSSTVASTNSTTGALIVKGGLGVAGNINSSGTIVTSSNIEGNGIKTKGSTAYLEMHDTNTLYSANPQSALVFRDGGNSQYSFIGPSNGSMLWNSWLPIELDTTAGVDLYVSMSGKVGIGTSSPTSNLDITGNIADNTSALRVGGTASAPIAGTYGASKLSFAANYIGYGAGPRAINLYPGATVDGHGIGLSNGLTEFYSNGNFGFFVRPNRADVNGTYTSTEAVRISSTGNMGIGTSAPAHLLHLKGAGPYIAFQDTDDPSGSLGTVSQFQTGAMYYDANFNNAATSGSHIFRADGGTKNLLTLTNSGNVGIGTLNPAVQLHVKSSAPNTQIRLEGATSGAQAEYYATANGISWVTGTGVGNVGSQNYGIYNSAIGANAMVLTASGSVGIGTQAPTSNLHINTGLSTTQYTGIKLENPFKTFTIGNNVPNNYNNIFGIFDGTTPRLWIGDTGNVAIGGTNPTYKFQVQKTASATPAIMISGGHSGGPRLQTYGLDADPLGFMGLGTDMSGDIYEHSIFTSGVSQSGKITFGQYNGSTFTERMRIHGNGNVGIGTNNPAQKLSVVGNISVTGQITSKDFFERTVTIPDGWAIGDYAEVVQAWPEGAGGSSNWEVHVGGTRGNWTEGTTYLITGTHAVGNAWREAPHHSESGYTGNSKCFTVDVNGNGNSPQFRIRAVKASASCGIAVPFGLNFRIRALGNNSTWTSLSATGTGATVVGMQPMGLSWNLYTGNPQGNGNLAIHANTAGNVGIGTTAPSEKLEVSGSVKAVAYLYTSDERLKKEIVTLPDALAKVLQLRGVNFVWRNNNEKTVGFIAQEVEAVFPELVKTDKVSGYKAVQYGNMVAILVEALKQEHEERVRSVASVAEQTNARMKQIEKENQDLKSRLEKLEKFFSEKTK